jgi:hypothetical protein
VGNTFRYTWAAAEIRWGYHVAASLTACELLVSEKGDRLTAHVAHGDPFRLAQRPLVFRINQAVPWVWPIESLTVEGDAVTAHLGPQQE